MQAVTDIRFEPDTESLMSRAHVQSGTADAEEFENLVKTAMGVARPKAAYRECFIDAKGNDTAAVDGITFET